MNRRAIIAVVLLAASQARCGTIEPYFAPGPVPEQVIVREIDQAKSRAWIQFYGFTSLPVRDALLRAAKRGVDVRVILDRSNLKQRSSAGPAIAAAGIPTLVDAAHPIAHNKIVIIDAGELLVGSYNATNQARANAENLQVEKDFPELVAKYAANWQQHAAHSQPWPVHALPKAKQPTAGR
jgi:phosphatidylserine/phosphatidylglycerophosphate/cardiolipin synthase-like enzyme